MRAIKELPQHLKKYVYPQEEVHYTFEDQAVWRFLLRQLSHYLKNTAYHCYADGLKGSGIPVDEIPLISNLDKNIREFGWSVVPVSGFIPPAAFMEFQSLGYLPVATAMRRIENILYTPAPDIVHETAGHAPILIDKEYAAYLRDYSEVANKAIISSEDLEQYQLIRKISDLKEAKDSEAINAHNSKIEKLEIQLATLSAQMKTSEAVFLGRMNWWTSEYGLIGNPAEPKIIGAGLLSSLGESKRVYTKEIKKLPLSVDCINYTYDITNHQPQLFVARDFQHMSDVLNELSEHLAYKRGGEFGLKKAIEANTVNSVEFENGLQVSGVIDSFETNNDQLTLVKLSGPTQISLNYKQLEGHNKEYHQQGYSTPMGAIKGLGNKPSTVTIDKWASQLGLKKDEVITLNYESGIVLTGLLTNFILDDNQRPLIMSFENCSVKKDDRIYFDPSWGTFDLAICSDIQSVFGGPADKSSFGETEEDFVKLTVSSGAEIDSSLDNIYKEIRSFRTSENKSIEAFKELEKEVLKNHPHQWLANIELFEMSKQLKFHSEDIHQNLNLINNETTDPDVKTCIQKGRELATLKETL